MKVILQDDRRYILRFDKGEEVLALLKNFLSENQIPASYFTGIGACNEAELAFYLESIKKYKIDNLRGDMEILSFTGNSAMLNNEVVIHSHAVLGKKDFTTSGGHVNKLVISATCEIFLIKLDGKMERKLDPGLNLNLLV
jgi:uncharacterized protein